MCVGADYSPHDVLYPIGCIAFGRIFITNDRIFSRKKKKWSQYIIDFLTQHLLLEKVSKARRKAIELEANNFTLIANQLYKRGKDKQFRLCIKEAQYVRVLEQAHVGLSGGNFSADTIAKAIMTAGLWWPTLFQDAMEFVKRCDECQRVKVPIR